MRTHLIWGRAGSSYLIEHRDGLFLVDAGFVDHWRTIAGKVRSLGRRLDDLKLAVVTHAHLDHFGGLPRLRDLAAFDVGCHPLAADALADGGKDVSPGRTPGFKLLELVARVSLPLLPFRGTKPTLMLPGGTRLHDRGLPATVVHTPGHTHGCVSLVLDDGSAFVGDLVTGPDKECPVPTPPCMAFDLGRVRESWRVLLEAGARRLFPAHGDPFGAEELLAVMRCDGLELPRRAAG